MNSIMSILVSLFYHELSYDLNIDSSDNVTCNTCHVFEEHRWERRHFLFWRHNSVFTSMDINISLLHLASPQTSLQDSTTDALSFNPTCVRVVWTHSFCPWYTHTNVQNTRPISTMKTVAAAACSQTVVCNPTLDSMSVPMWIRYPV